MDSIWGVRKMINKQVFYGDFYKLTSHFELLNYKHDEFLKFEIAV